MPASPKVTRQKLRLELAAIRDARQKAAAHLDTINDRLARIETVLADLDIWPANEFEDDPNVG